MIVISLLWLVTLLSTIVKLKSDEVVQPKSDGYFAICMIARSEPNLAEWVEYHYRTGCDKFYIFDHNSSEPLLPLVEKYVKMGIVDLKRIDDESLPKFNLSRYPGGTLQKKIYNKCIEEHKNDHSFIGFIDSDEYIVLPQNANVLIDHQKPHIKLPDVLKKYENYGGIALNWMMFGSSGHDRKPSGGVIENYHKCVPNYHIKTIVNTKYVIRNGGSPHHFETQPLRPVVDTNFQPVPRAFNPSDGKTTPNATLFQELYINHYHLKSFEEFEEKISRGVFHYKGKFSIDYFKALDKHAIHNCSILQMPASRVK